MDTFQINLKRAREFKGWSQQRIAIKAGLKRHNIAAYEEGRANPNPDDLGKIFKAFWINDISFIDDPNFIL